MSIIENKKGNTGYIVSHWNTRGGFEYCNSSGFTGEWSYMIRHVEIKSCGKIQMTCSMLDDGGEMAKMHYCPKTEVFNTLENAKNSIPSDFEKCLDKAVEENDETLQKVVDGYAEYQNKYWLKGLNEAKANHELITNRKITCKILTWTPFVFS